MEWQLIQMTHLRKYGEDVGERAVDLLTRMLNTIMESELILRNGEMF